MRAEGDFSRHRWTVDTADDLRLVTAVYERLGERAFTWRDVLALVEREARIMAINRSVEQKELAEG